MIIALFDSGRFRFSIRFCARSNRSARQPWEQTVFQGDRPEPHAGGMTACRVVFATAGGRIISEGIAAEATSIRVGYPNSRTMVMTCRKLGRNDWLTVGTEGTDGFEYCSMSGGVINAFDFAMNVTGPAPGTGASLSTMTMTGNAIISRNDITATFADIWTVRCCGRPLKCGELCVAVYRRRSDQLFGVGCIH